jgi:PAS domain S-box-containing protein
MSGNNLKTEATKKNTELLTLALEATTDALWDWHIPTGNAFFSPRYYTMLGFEPDEFAAGYDSWTGLLHPDDRKITTTRIQQHIQNKSESFAEEFRLRTKSGDYLWVLGRAKVVERDDKGKPVRMVGTHVDIDARKRAEARLALYREKLEDLVKARTAELEKTNRRLSKEIGERKQAVTEREKALRELEKTTSLLETVFDAIPDIIGVQDNDHRMIRYNAAGYKFLDKKQQDIVGRHCFELIGRKNECTICATSKAYQTKRPAQIERFDETLNVWLDVRAYPVLDKDGNLVNVIEHLRDITAEKKAAEENRKLLEKLQHAQKMEAIGTLAGGIAHDFNNLLMGILGNASLLHHDLESLGPERERVANIERLAKSGAQLTKQLLGIGRGGRYEVRAVDLNVLIDKAADMFGRTKKEIQIHKRFDNDLWPVEVDQAQINQVLLNIFVNAWQAMPAGGTLMITSKNTELDRAFVSPYGVSAGRYVNVSIQDTGIGMDANTVQRVFDPFFTTKEKERGTGLGLASAYGIIKNHAGIITVDSVTGRGATFSFYLPATDKPVQPYTRTDHKASKGSGTILVIDDESIILEVAEQMVERLGYEVMTATDGDSAIEILASNAERVDLIILDMIMPGKGGEETFKALKDIRPEVKILLSSGYSIEGKAKQIMAQGCDGFIQKPFDLTELSHKIDKILN